MTSRNRRVSSTSKPVATKPARSSQRDRLMQVIDELEAGTGTRADTDPITEQLKQCPEAFKAGEMVGKMFDVLKYSEDDSAGDERYLPPAGVVIPLV